ncbi:MAG TPA: hypothetical protein VFM65_06110 [Flavobacteriaceae bacterium]|nr:hypothetical protein [Flavobacteriaceae bacterium]
MNIKNPVVGFVLFCLVFNSFSVRAQEEEETENTQQNKEYVLLSVGYVYPLPFGENVANEAYSMSGGFEHSVWAHVSLDIWVGAELTIFGADVERKELTGNYNDVNIFSLGPMAGYKFHFGKKTGLLLGAGVGYVKYTNHHPDYKFYDDGTALWFTADFEYDITNHMGWYFSGKLRRDFLKTELSGNKNYFDSNYLMLSLGIRVTI